MSETAIIERNESYHRYVEAVSPKTSVVKSLFHSFWLGGLTCLVSQFVYEMYEAIFPKSPQDYIASITLMTIVSVAILLTGIGVFDKMARFGGAGLFLPITGFANAISSAAMEYKTEGLILGTSTKMFTVVGPVIVNGIVWSTLAGIIHFIIFSFMG